MEAIEFETRIDQDGHVQLPKQFQHLYGKFARLLVLLPAESASGMKKRKPGSAKGILKIISDDDEHLDDFVGYMP